jgi:hypothetical protein
MAPRVKRDIPLPHVIKEEAVGTELQKKCGNVSKYSRMLRSDVALESLLRYPYCSMPASVVNICCHVMSERIGGILFLLVLR